MDVAGNAVMLMTQLDCGALLSGLQGLLLELPSDLGNTVTYLQPPSCDSERGLLPVGSLPLGDETRSRGNLFGSYC